MQVRQTRDYLRSRTASYNWLHLSHLSALKEYAFMQALHTHGFPVPQAVDVNRHAVLMALVDGVPLASLRSLNSPAAAWRSALDLMVRLAQHGLVHCDFNEFNLMVDDGPDGSEALTLIDFPQMVSTNHLNATTYYARDVACLQRFFVRRFDFRPLDAGLDDGAGGLHSALGTADSGGDGDAAAGEDRATRLDASLRASGFGTKEREQLEAGLAAVRASLGPEEQDRTGDAYRRRGSDDEDEEEEEEEEESEGASLSEGETSEEEDEVPPGGDGGAQSDDEDGDGDDSGIPDACEPTQSALAAAFLQRQRELHAPAVEVGGADAGSEEDGEGGTANAATAPSVSVGLSVRQSEVRDRLRAERRRAGGARAVAAGSVRRTNYSKDKSGSHKKGSNSSASDAVWG